MVTRRVHVVRIKQTSNPGNFVDVKVIDAISYQGPNGHEVMLDCATANINPYINDTTPEGNGKGDPGDCSRSSKITRIGASGASGSMLDIEQLNACTMRGPNGFEVLLFFRGDDASAIVVDKTGSGFSSNPGAGATRSTHLEKISAGDPQDPSKFFLVERVDAIAFIGPNGHENLFFNPGAAGDANEIDTTEYGDDGTPPDNTDPNVYVAWPPQATDPWIGTNEGASGIIKQGPLWWIINANKTDEPWYWYLPKQQFANELVIGGWIEGTFGHGNFFDGFTVDGFGPPDKIPAGDFYIPTGDNTFVQHPAVFVLLPCIGITYQDGEVTSQIGNIPESGFSSLEDAIDNGTPDDSNHLGFTPPNTMFTDAAAYGILPLRTPPVDDAGIHTGVPNIWQLTGLPQPPLQDPTKPWDDPEYFLRHIDPAFAAGTNPYSTPSTGLASDVVNTFVSMWNSSSQSATDMLPNPDPSGVPPGWAFKTPFNGGGGPGSEFAFIGGITVGWGIFPLSVLNPATSGFIAAAQLDPTKWDTTQFPPVRKPPPPGGGGGP